MTDADTTERPETGLYVTDAEICRRMGVPEKKARMAIRAWDMDPRSGFPKKDKFMGDRRYWPAIRAFLDKRNRVIVDAPPNHRGRIHG